MCLFLFYAFMITLMRGSAKPVSVQKKSEKSSALRERHTVEKTVRFQTVKPDVECVCQLVPGRVAPDAGPYVEKFFGFLS